MPRPRVLFFGYGAVGCACLRDLLDGFEVAGVFCRASDRTQRATAVDSLFSLAAEASLHCFAATDPSDPEFLAAATSLRPDLLLSIQYDRILKPALLSIPAHGAFNLHFGPLPRLRGCFPTKWAILGNEPAGVTFHCIDPDIDSGDIVDQQVVPLAAGETDQTLYTRLQEIGHGLFRRQLPWLRALTPPQRRPQDPAQVSYHPKQIPFGGILDWTREARWLERFVRAFTFPPHPAARTWLRGVAIEPPRSGRGRGQGSRRRARSSRPRRQRRGPRCLRSGFLATGSDPRRRRRCGSYRAPRGGSGRRAVPPLAMRDLPRSEVMALIDAAPATAADRRVRYRGYSLVAVMASWNEEGKVGAGVSAVPRDIVDTVCVVDNGSADGTAAEARAAGAVVLSHPRNLGAGGGYRSGYMYGRRHGFEVIVEPPATTRMTQRTSPRWSIVCSTASWITFTGRAGWREGSGST